MKRQLVFIHGRAQEKKDSIALKAEWLEALRNGLQLSNLILPIPEEDVRFAFYGDTLNDLVEGKSAEDAAAVIVRGEYSDVREKRFSRAILKEILKVTGISESQLDETIGQDVNYRGPFQWEWFQGFLKAIDQYAPHISGASIALFTHDVYQYLKNPMIREKIDNGVSKAILPKLETIVVAHSLGTVVAYNLLRQYGHLRNWKVPLFITVGSPLSVTEIRKTLQKFARIRCPECVSHWFNAMDEKDVVALYPLNTIFFPLDPVIPAIENKQDVNNNTINHHGIIGYLNDKEVASRIYEGLLAGS